MSVYLIEREFLQFGPVSGDYNPVSDVIIRSDIHPLQKFETYLILSCPWQLTLNPRVLAIY